MIYNQFILAIKYSDVMIFVTQLNLSCLDVGVNIIFSFQTRYPKIEHHSNYLRMILPEKPNTFSILLCNKFLIRLHNIIMVYFVLLYALLPNLEILKSGSISRSATLLFF